jgi:alkanesulfonate monooxygenase SsuD/methylene tetrahydromethanopterin reductase-like flavin-dependent oxidoreductase (luciferase family)
MVFGNSTSLPIGLLEYLDVVHDGGIAEKQRAAFRGALLAEEIGYQRVWIPEHHGPGSPCASPVTVSAAVGSHTSRIRVGSAVSLLRVRDPYLTLVDFYQAAYLCDGRLDIGLGRGDVGGPMARFATHLRKTDDEVQKALEEFPELMSEYAQAVEPLPSGCEVWLHGSGIRSAEMAAKLGLNYCHALFLNPDIDTCIWALRRHRERGSRTRSAVALAVVVNPDEDVTGRPLGKIGLKISCAGPAADCARTALRAVALADADELIIAELSEPARHLSAIEELYAAVQDRVRTWPGTSRQVPAAARERR